VRARAVAALALVGALASGGCVHYPTILEAGGTMLRPDKGRLVRLSEGAEVYFDLRSNGMYGDTVKSVVTPVARVAQLVDGKGQPLATYELPGAKVIVFDAKGPHVVLKELTRPLVPGESVIVTLMMDKSGGLGVIAVVE
jgi:copper(I)-binding protein